MTPQVKTTLNPQHPLTPRGTGQVQASEGGGSPSLCQWGVNTTIHTSCPTLHTTGGGREVSVRVPE